METMMDDDLRPCQPALVTIAEWLTQRSRDRLAMYCADALDEVRSDPDTVPPSAETIRIAWARSHSTMMTEARVALHDGTPLVNDAARTNLRLDLVRPLPKGHVGRVVELAEAELGPMVEQTLRTYRRERRLYLGWHAYKKKADAHHRQECSESWPMVTGYQVFFADRETLQRRWREALETRRIRGAALAANDDVVEAVGALQASTAETRVSPTVIVDAIEQAFPAWAADYAVREATQRLRKAKVKLDVMRRRAKRLVELLSASEVDDEDPLYQELGDELGRLKDAIPRQTALVRVLTDRLAASQASLPHPPTERVRSAAERKQRSRDRMKKDVRTWLGKQCAVDGCEAAAPELNYLPGGAQERWGDDREQEWRYAHSLGPTRVKKEFDLRCRPHHLKYDHERFVEGGRRRRVQPATPARAASGV